MFIEISPADAAERGVKDGGWVWVTGAENSSKAKMKALVTERVGKGVAWMPFHFGGWFEGEDLRGKYPQGTDPIVLGESATPSPPTATIRRPACRSPRSPCVRSERLKEATTMARMKFLCDADRCIECNACVTACKNEHEVPWGINRRRVVTLNDGKPGERSVSMACMHCTDAPCAAVCPVNCFYTTADAVVLHSKDLCIGCGYCFYACPFGAPQYPKVGNFGSRGKMDKCTFCAGGPEADGSKAEYEKYGANRLAEGKLPLCAEMCSTKSLLAGDGDVIARSTRNACPSAATAPAPGAGRPHIARRSRPDRSRPVRGRAPPVEKNADFMRERCHADAFRAGSFDRRGAGDRIHSRDGQRLLARSSRIRSIRTASAVKEQQLLAAAQQDPGPRHHSRHQVLRASSIRPGAIGAVPQCHAALDRRHRDPRHDCAADHLLSVARHDEYRARSFRQHHRAL